MPRPRKPTKLLAIQGGLRATRHRDRENEPEVIQPLGGPPEGWRIEAKLLWAELSDLLPPGVACKADRIMFETLLRLVARMRESHEILTPALAAQIRTACACFGMSPADRSRVSAPRLPEGVPETLSSKPDFAKMLNQILLDRVIAPEISYTNFVLRVVVAGHLGYKLRLFSY